MKFTVNPSQMNLTWYIIYGGHIMSIWWKQQSVCEAAATKLLRCSTLHLVSSSGGRRIRLSLNLGKQAACGPKGLCKAHCEMQSFTLPSCKAAVCPLLNLLKNKGLAETRPQREFTFTVCQWTTVTTDGTRKDVSFWFQNIYWRAWIDGHVVFCHPVPHWSW